MTIVTKVTKPIYQVTEMSMCSYCTISNSNHIKDMPTSGGVGNYGAGVHMNVMSRKFPVEYR